MREKPWCAVPLLDDTLPTQWFESELAALSFAAGKPYTVQYRPGRKPKGKPRA